MRPLKLKHVAANSQHRCSAPLRQQNQQGNAVKGADWPTDDGWYAVALQVAHQQISGGGQIGKGGGSVSRRTSLQPLANRLPADPKQPRRFRLAYPPSLQRLCKGRPGPSPTEALGKDVKPGSLVPVRQINLRRSFLWPKPLQQCFASQQGTLPCFSATIRQPPLNVNPQAHRMSAVSLGIAACPCSFSVASRPGAAAFGKS